MSKYRSSNCRDSTSNLLQSLKLKYPQKKYDMVPKKSSIDYYLSVIVKYKPDDNYNPTYINVKDLDPYEPMFVGNSHIRKNIDAVLDIGYRPNAIFNILLRMCYTPKHDDKPPYFQISILVYVFHTIIKKNTTQLTELFMLHMNDIKNYLLECCYGNNDKGFIIYRPIEIAAFYGNVEAFKQLISNGARYDKQNQLNESLHDIIHAGILRLNSSNDELSIFFQRDNFLDCLNFLEITRRSNINENPLSLDQL